MAILTARDLTAGWKGSAVTGQMNFHVNRGDYLCIVGENGSGKSTLLKTIFGLIRPVSGIIEFDRTKAGYLPQQTNLKQDFPANVREIVLSGCEDGRKGPFYSSRQKQKAADAMRLLGVGELEKESFRRLSGGQKQRVMLARALCGAADILVADEPVTGLDPQAAAQMYRILKALNDRGMAVVCVTHDPAALKYARTVLRVGGQPEFIRRSRA